jgi:hypothetical protein
MITDLATPIAVLGTAGTLVAALLRRSQVDLHLAKL